MNRESRFSDRERDKKWERKEERRKKQKVGQKGRKRVMEDTNGKGGISGDEEIGRNTKSQERGIRKGEMLQMVLFVREICSKKDPRKGLCVI